MKSLLLTACLISMMAATSPAQSSASPTDDCLVKSGNGVSIPVPSSHKTYEVADGSQKIQVPQNMVYLPACDFTPGIDPKGQPVHVAAFCIGRFDVTNAEFKAFLDATGSQKCPGYWKGGTYPDGKANHPVVYVSLTQATQYVDWMAKQTGWKIVIPTANQWERAARPENHLYPWGNTTDTRFTDGVLTSKFNFNGVTAAHCLKNQATKQVTYNNPKSKYFGVKTTVDRIAGFDAAGKATYLSVGGNGSVTGWVNHATYTGFIYTDLFTAMNDAGGNTNAVGSYETGKSAFGCYDMAGNVWNWCSNTITANNGAEKGQTVNEIRGGSWYATSSSCRSIAIGEGRRASGGYNTVGFRVAMLFPAGQ